MTKPSDVDDEKPQTLRRHTEVIIFGTSTPAGQGFDILLLIAILISVSVVLLDSVSRYHALYGPEFRQAEMLFTALFTLEYAARIWSSQRRTSYIFSVWGVVDLLSILPTYIALLVPEASPLLVVRLIRILRVFRVLRMDDLFRELVSILEVLSGALKAVFIFAFSVCVLVVVFGSLIYVVEGPENGFTSIPMSMYWAIVTVTTVGYGDLVPQTGWGKLIASAGMLVGYSIIAVPTAIMTVKALALEERRHPAQTLAWNCPNCAGGGHPTDAEFCKHCGSELDVPSEIRRKAKRKRNGENL